MEKNPARRQKKLICGISAFKQMLIARTTPLLSPPLHYFLTFFSAKAFTLDDDATNAAAALAALLRALNEDYTD
jgi:hypothetical protein